MGACGHEVVILGHGDRTIEITSGGLVARDIDTGSCISASVSIATSAEASTFDVVLIALRRGDLREGVRGLARLRGRPLILPFGNYYGAALPARWDGAVSYGFPGVAGSLRAGVAEYVQIPQQPMTLQRVGDPRLRALGEVLACRGSRIRRVQDMVGWLAYHAVFMTCIVAALDRHRADPVVLSYDRSGLS